MSEIADVTYPGGVKVTSAEHVANQLAGTAPDPSQFEKAEDEAKRIVEDAKAEAEKLVDEAKAAAKKAASAAKKAEAKAADAVAPAAPEAPKPAEA